MSMCAEITSPIAYIARYNNYLKTRMDFLADIATSMPTMETGRAFKADIMKELDANRLLLNSISGVDNFKFTFDFKYISDSHSAGDNIDPIISIPNDVLGYHALYIIIENIIRNTAKHSITVKKKKDATTVFTFEIQDTGDDFYKLKIYDDVDLKHKIDQIVKIQNRNITDKILKENKLRDGAWGVLEMKASAAYLRKINLEHLDLCKAPNNGSQKLNLKEYEGEPFLLNTINVKVGSKSCLGYELFLRKPKNLLVWDFDNMIKVDNRIVESERKRSGIFIEKDNLRIESTIYTHKLLLISTVNRTLMDIGNILLSNKSGLPKRIVWHNKTETDEVFCIVNFTNASITSAVNERQGTVRAFPIPNITPPVTLDYNSLFQVWLIGFQNYTNRGLSIYGDSVLTTSKKLVKSIFDANLPRSIRLNGAAKKYNIINQWDDHSGNLEVFLKEFKKEDGVIKLYEPLSSNARTRIVKLFEVSNTSNLIANCLQLYNYYISSICVIDERLQRICSDDDLKIKKINRQKLYDEYGLVYMPSESDVNLNEMVFDENATNKIVKFLNRKKVKPDFLLIHLGIIEKLIYSQKGTNDKEKNDVERFLQEEFQSKFPTTEFIIISGRGRPYNLPDSIPYINYSAVQQYVIDIKLKYLLFDLVYASRKLK